MLYRSVISDNAVSRSVITAPLLIQPAAYTYTASLHVAEYHRATQIASARFYLQCTTLTSRGCESGQEALNCQLTSFEAGPWATTGCKAG